MAQTRNANKRPNNASKPSSSTSSTAKAKKGKDTPKSKPTGKDILESLSDEQKAAMLASLQKDMKAKKRSLQEDKNRAIQAVNRSMLEEEESDAEENLEHPYKRSRMVVALSADEQDMINQLKDAERQEEEESGGSADEGRDKEDEEDNEDNEGAQEVGFGSDEDVQDKLLPESSPWDPPSMSQDQGNGITVSNKDKGKKLLSKVSSVRSLTFSSTSLSSCSATPNHDRIAKQSSKVVEADFPQDIRELATASKVYIRMVTAFDTPFPPATPAARLDFLWNVVTETAKHINTPGIRTALNRVSSTLSMKRNLTTFTMYGCTALISSVIGKAWDLVQVFYGFTGDVSKVAADVKWLLEKSHFIFEGINLKEHTYKEHTPFFSELIISIIEHIWAPSSRSKLESDGTARLLKEEKIPMNMILLVATAIDHALREWSTGQAPSGKTNFSEPGACAIFARLQSTWNNTAKNTQVWEAFCQKALFKKIVKSYDQITQDHSDVGDLNFSELDRIAQAGMAEFDS